MGNKKNKGWKEVTGRRYNKDGTILSGIKGSTCSTKGQDCKESRLRSKQRYIIQHVFKLWKLVVAGCCRGGKEPNKITMRI